MEHTPSNRQVKIKSLITHFLSERLAAKLEKLSDDDPKRAELQTQFQPETWLEDAARRATQIQAVTHTLKAVHPDAKGTNLHAPPSSFAKLPLLSSRSLANGYELDVVGNAASLDVYKFLRLTLQDEGETLLSLAQKQDADLASALSSNTDKAQARMQAFASLLEAKGKPTSHTLAKQIYWPVADDAHRQDSFHLLEPLHASSLAQCVYERVQEDRFGDSSQPERDALKAKTFHANPVRRYPHLAVQQMGGTKPQNISQLNSQRRGNNYLFASLPPNWVSEPVKPIWHVDNLFWRFGQRDEVRRHLLALKRFLYTNPDPTKPTRERRAGHISALMEAFLLFTLELRDLPPGWSRAPECKLSRAQSNWLDPALQTDDDAITGEPLGNLSQSISEDFALWLNSQLQNRHGGNLPVGEDEYHEWRRLMRETLKAFERGEYDLLPGASATLAMTEANHV